MRIQLKLRPQLTQKLKLTPRMRLAFCLLQMPLAKVKEFIREQVELNPLLNIVKSDDALFRAESPNFRDEEKQSYQERLPAVQTTLQEHLLSQLRLIVQSEEEQGIGELIIASLDDNGYLKVPIAEIAEAAQTTPLKAENVLFTIQTFDPVGVGARDLRECLLLQLETRQEEGSLAYRIVDKYLAHLAKKKNAYIARELKAPIEAIKEAAKRITRLEPKPGRSFGKETAVRLIPDASLRKNKQGYEVILNDKEIPQLTINEKYRQMLLREDTADEVREYVRGRVNAALSLIDGIKKRRETLCRIIEEMVSFQKDFLGRGESYFKPLTLEYIAKRINKHKSTVSRAIANKYLETPWGIRELRSFLSAGIRQEDGTFFSSKAVRAKIKGLIKRESKIKTLTDQAIVRYFKQQGISVSRRAVAKYRRQLKILPSGLRQG